jgi:1-acyl-sn-glycerol-3-phosphate acyltransferase
MVLMAELPDPSFVLKKELGQLPVFGWYARANGFVFVDRAAGASAMRAMTVGAKAAAARGQQVVIFPEGTRVGHGAPPRYLPGIAALSKALSLPAVPLAHDAGAYWGKGSEHRAGTVRFRVLAPVPPGLPRRDLMQRLETVIEAETNALYARSGAEEPKP